MESPDLHHEVRELITQADHLSRRAYAAHRERDAEVFASLRTSLQRIDRMLGGMASRDFIAEPTRAAVSGQVDIVYQRVRDAAARANAVQRAEMVPLLATAERLHESVAPPRLLVKKMPSYLRGLD